VLGESVESDGGVCRGNGRGNNGGREGVCVCPSVFLLVTGDGQ
jgi:hypothetical protein